MKTYVAEIKQHLEDVKEANEDVQQFVDKFRSKVTQPLSAKGKSTLAKIFSKGILGKLKTKITAKLNRIISKVAPKFTKAKRLFDLAKSGLKGLVKLGTAALAVWTAVETFDNCKRKAAEAKESVKNMKTYVAEIKQHLEDVKEANEDVQQAWMDVYNTSMATDLIDALKDMRAMMLEDYFSTASNKEEKDNVAEKIQEYIDVEKLNPDQEDTKSILNNRQRAMNQVLGTITVTLSCFRHKGNAFGAVKLECARGDSPFPYIFDDIVNKVPIDPAKKCLYRTGEEYITEEKMREAWTRWVEGNATDIDATCLVNNKLIVDQVKDFLRKKENDASQIAGKLLRDDKINRGGVEEIQAVITKIKEENPNIENEMTQADKDMVCRLKNSFPDNAQQVIDTMKIVNPDVGATLTVEIVNNLQCD
ncbi:uncharacterized protein LOC110240018 [Exaiptasia diaphana]|uniref:Uncharacterized protein n=1 Tax=Exaiptasia diaphana TaxID=2652724 RepID=A0A913YLN5_EXADI|nr:uncharacterized protein LOC110240018 [Exaiptasia diaphana]